jgi:hypothetical protein
VRKDYEKGVTWLPHLSKRRILELVLGIAIWVVLVIVVTITSRSTLPLGTLIATGAALLGAKFSDQILDFIFGREVPILSFEPLEVTPETKFNGIQFLNMAWAGGRVRVENGKIVENTIIQNTLEAKFGIIRVKNKGSDAQNCRVAVRYQARAYRTEDYVWAENGHLNWYSDSKRKNLTQVRELDLTELGILLENTTEDVHHDESKYLQIGFFNKQGPAFFLCTDTRSYPLLSLWELSGYDPEDPTSLEKLHIESMTNHARVELTVSALNYPVTKKTYDVAVTRDSIRISECKNQGIVPRTEF